MKAGHSYSFSCSQLCFLVLFMAFGIPGMLLKSLQNIHNQAHYFFKKNMLMLPYYINIHEMPCKSKIVYALYHVSIYLYIYLLGGYGLSRNAFIWVFEFVTILNYFTDMKNYSV